MPSLFTLGKKIHEGSRAIIYRAVQNADQRPVILKILDPRSTRPRDMERLKNEYQLGRAIDSPAVARALALVTYEGMPALVIEDSGGESLDRLLRDGEPMPLARFLPLAVKLAAAVTEVHSLGLIHKDLKPQNILVHPTTGAVQLTDLGLASRLPREQQAAQLPRLIEGSLPYMSPEQTGRVSRVVDNRADLYSLGVTLYQMLTGRLPFEAGDPVEWVYCHVARVPPSPVELIPELPETLAHIVLKLLAKMPEDRYQSAGGLLADLERCLAQWQACGRIEPFPLGRDDVPTRFLIPHMLYGREREVATLLTAFAAVATTGLPALVTVSGYSGVGKSSLVNALHKPTVEKRGYFITGKIDQYKRDIPYATLAQAFRSLVLQILGESEARIRQWRDALCEALGPSGQLMVNLIPELELVIGPQPPVPELPPQEAQHRYQMLVRQLIGVFARAAHPLVLFLDDLQWLDAGTLGLIADLATHPDVHYLLLVGAYRDNEVDASHPLVRCLEAIQKAGGAVREIVLSPLSQDDVEKLVADALHGPPERVRPLAQLVFEKTGGNPFFVIQFLTALVEEDLLRFDPGIRAWSWDLPRIHEKGYTDNVVQLMVGKLTRLLKGTRDALKQFAALGNVADIGTLGLVLGQSTEEIHAALGEAVQAGLVLCLEDAYAFLHDRVQEAAYSLIPEEARAATHLYIGRILLSSLTPEEIAERIFDVVNQLDRGSAEVESQEERERIAALELLAGKRAKEATAYASALRYLAAGAALLTADRWERLYGLSFALELHRAECEFLTGALEAAEQRLAMLWERAQSIVDRAAVTCLRVDVYTTLDRSDRAVAVCLDYLRQLGVDWSPHPTQAEVRQEYERIWSHLDRDRIESLVDLPLMNDKEAQATMEVLSRISPATLFTDENLMCLLTLRSVNLSLTHGSSDASANAYAWLGMILGPYFADYATAFRFGQLAVNLVDKRGLDGCKARVYLMFGNFIVPWARALRSGQQWQRRAFDAATKVGDLTYASYICNSLITNMLASGDPLAEVEREAVAGLAFARKVQFGLVIDIILAQLRLVRMLRGLTEDFTSFNSADFDEAKFEQRLEANPSLAIACCWYWIRKLQGRLFARDYAAALTAATKAQGLLWTSRSFFEQAEYHFYAALAHAAACTAVPADQRSPHRDALAAHHRQLAIWAEHCPENFENRRALCAAEIARIEGRDLEAIHLYEQAIRSAHDGGFVQNEALANELAGRFYFDRGLDKSGLAYLRDARACYALWGADGKVKQLDQQHPRLFEPRTLMPTATVAVRPVELDLYSVARASQTISSEIVLDKLVRTLLTIVLQQGGAQRACLVLCRDERLSIEAEATLQDNGIVATALSATPVDGSLRIPVSVVLYAHRTKERVILSDATADAGRFAGDDYFARHRPKSVLCLPILRQAAVVGLLYLENALLADAFTPERLLALDLLAPQAAISIENARLLECERTARRDAEAAQVRAERLFQERQRTEAEVRFIAESSKLLAESLDYRSTLTRVARLAVPFLADWCMIDVLRDGRLCRIVGTHVDPAKEPLLHELEKSQPVASGSPHPAATAVATGKTYLLPDITYPIIRAHSPDDAHADIVYALGSRSAMAVPLIAHGSTVGAMTFTSSRPGFHYGPGSVALAEELARRAAVAIENARLYGEAQESIRARDEFLTVASHELRTPVTSLLLSVQSLRSGKLAPSPANIERMAARMDRQATRLASLINEMMDVGRIHLGRLEFQLAQMDLVALVREVIARMTGVLSQAGCPIVLCEQGPVVGRWNHDKLGQVVASLLANSIKFAPGQPIEISISKLDGRARLTVTDHGIGIDAEALPHIFEKFKRAVSCSQYGGLGLGLYIARNLVEALGGTVHAESVPGLETTFTVELPLAGPKQPSPQAPPS